MTAPQTVSEEHSRQALAADLEARRRAQRELRRPLLVEAGAGTGKTATLVARILAWCLDDGWQLAAARDRDRPASQDREQAAERLAGRVLGGVVAITFTEAAAAEMTARVQSALAELTRGDTPTGFDRPPDITTADLEQRARQLLAAVDQLQVRTIHAFCRGLLAAHPFEARLHPRLTIDTDGSLVAEIAERTVEAALAAAYGDPGDADFLFLAGRGHGPLEIANALTELAGAGVEPGSLVDDPLVGPRLAELVRQLEEIVEPLLTLLELQRPGGNGAQLAAQLTSGLAQLRRRLRLAREATPQPRQLAGWVGRYLPDNLAVLLATWARGEAQKSSTDARLTADLATLAGRLYRLRRHVLQLDPELMGSARRVLAPLLAAVHAEMRRRGVIGFQDLLREAHALLTSDAEIRARTRRQIDQLLIDELQDTDAVQCDLIRALALSGPPGERPGLFAVGDPKQSIYGWRNADLAAYEDFAEAIERAGGERLVLVRNFRSAAPILAEVERLTAPVMRRRAGLQPAFRPLLAAAAVRPFREAGRTAIEHWVSWLPASDSPLDPAAEKAAETARLEARAVAGDLLELRRQQAIVWRDVAILLRSLSDLELYLAALRDAGIPFVVSRDRQYYRRREILDAAALVRAVLAPEDNLALVAYLRSPMAGVPDAALLPLWSRDLPRQVRQLNTADAEQLATIGRCLDEVAATLPASVPGLERVRGWQASTLFAVAALGELRRSFATDPADAFVDRLRRLTLYEAGEAARHLGIYRLANLERFFAELQGALEAEKGDRHRVLRRLGGRIAQGYEAEEAQPADTNDDAVRVMTIHKAKGLEFRHVYMLQTHKETGQHRAPAFDFDLWRGRAEYRLFGTPSAGFAAVEARRREIEGAELVRTLYVATTRASERLVIAGRRPVDDRGADLSRAKTHLDLIRHRRGGEPQLRQAWSRGEARIVDDAVSWVLPALVDRQERWQQLETPRLQPVATIAAAGDQLQSQRQQALLRMARPLRQSASQLAKAPASSQTPTVTSASDAAAVGDRPPLADGWFVSAATTAPEQPDADRRVAIAAGSAIHRLLESFDLDTAPALELERQRQLLPEYVRTIAAGDEALAALARAERLFERFAGGELLARFVALGERLIARELPVLLAHQPVAGAEDAHGYVSGVIDLIYRDRDEQSSDEQSSDEASSDDRSGRDSLVIVDFKTDLLTPGTSLAWYSQRYAAQGAVYVRALREALGLSRSPRFELWYLDADRVEVLDLQGDDKTSLR